MTWQLGEWIEYWDDEAQSYYYYNSVTHEASWTPPEGLMALDNSSTSGTGARAAEAFGFVLK